MRMYGTSNGSTNKYAKSSRHTNWYMKKALFFSLLIKSRGTLAASL